MGWKFGIGSTATELSLRSTVSTGVLQASPVVPLMFIAHEPQIAERHERRKRDRAVLLGLGPLECVEHRLVRRHVDLDAIPVRNLVDGLS